MKTTIPLFYLLEVGEGRGGEERLDGLLGGGGVSGLLGGGSGYLVCWVEEGGRWFAGWREGVGGLLGGWGEG